ncbi:MAG: hypothetical protein DRJ43_01335 [Thermoprotei archaeon]|nr:MAG: hypothetical protein DRJ43_01335 [Thermoprotei archaeon]
MRRSKLNSDSAILPSVGGGCGVLHRPDQRMFLIRLEPGSYAFVKYEVVGNKLYITRTYTPEKFRGGGLASRLTERVVLWAKERGFKVVPVCSFAISFFKKRRDLHYLLDEEALETLNL